MKHHEESCNASVSTVSTDISVAEKTQNNKVFKTTLSNYVTFTEYKHEKKSKEPVWKCRYTTVLLLFLGYFYITGIRLNISININAMVNSSAIGDQDAAKSFSCRSLENNFTEPGKNLKMLSKEGEYDWSPKIQGYILASYFFGHVTSQLPGGLLAERYGSKLLLLVSTLGAGVCTLFIPLFCYVSVSGIIVLQVLRGALQGFIQPCHAVLSANWFPKVERGFFFSLAQTGAPLGCCLGSIISGFICESAGGWPVSFYAFGAWGCLTAVLVFFFMAESPREHPTISKAELNFIISNEENTLSKRRPKAPWSKILTSIPVYALAFAFFGQFWAITQFWTVHSIFLATIHHYDIRDNGLLTSGPFALQFLFAQIVSWISLLVQKKKICGVNLLRKILNSAACLGISFCLLGTYLSGCNSTLSVIFSMFSLGCTGIAFAGCWVAAPDMSPTFAGTVHAICLTIGTTATCLLPVVVGYLTDERQTIEQWNNVFFIGIGIVMSSGIAFAIFGSADVQPWNTVEEKIAEKSTKEENNVTEDIGNKKAEEQYHF